MLARVVLAVMAVLGSLAVAACGGGNDAGDGGDSGNKTFQGDGYSFSYPGEWAEQEGQGNTGRVDVVVAPPEGGQDLVALTVIRNASAQPVTKANVERAARPGIEALMQRAGGVLESNPTKVTYGGLPGLRFESSSIIDPSVHLQGTWLFDGTTAYTFSCQSTPSRAEEVRQACELVLGSFQISG